MKVRAFGFATVVAVLFSGTTSFGAFDLQITEIWPGNEPGENLSEDWFELTNFGDMTFDSSVDGNLYFEDESADWTTGDQLFFNTSDPVVIQPGQSVVFSDGGVLEAFNLFTLWDPELSFPLGQYNGSGLGQGGDTVVLFHDADMNGLDAADPIITQGSYPDAESFGGRSYDLVIGAFSHPSFAVSTIDVNDAGQSAIGTPGYVPSVPEPSSVLLILLGGSLGVAMLRRR